MRTPMIGKEIDNLIRILAKLPGLGPRSARRVALHLLKQKETAMAPLIYALQTTAAAIRSCHVCNNLDSSSPCSICKDRSRDASIICVVEDVSDLWAIERTGFFRGTYHVLGGTLSALDGVGPDSLAIPQLMKRAKAPEVREIILALKASIDGQTTAHYLMSQLAYCDVSVSRLAHGIPVGAELDHLDDTTLATALRSRTKAA